MIVAAFEDRLRLITQHDHAALAADLLRLWRSGGVADHRFREQILWAVREHDNGWREADSSPQVAPDGTVYDYRSIPGPARREIWLRGCERYLESHPLESVLIIEHGRRLHRDQRGDPEWEEFFERLHELGAKAVEREPESQSVVAAYPHLARCDGLSLALCEGAETRELAGGYSLHRVGGPAGDGDVSYRLDPFPFAGATRFRVAGRWVDDREWASSTQLASALAEARWTRIDLLLQP